MENDIEKCEANEERQSLSVVWGGRKEYFSGCAWRLAEVI